MATIEDIKKLLEKKQWTDVNECPSGGYYDFPHTRNYDSDLGFLIRKYKELGNDYNILVKIYEYIAEEIEDLTLNQLKEWLDDGTLENILRNLTIHFKVNVVDNGIDNTGNSDVTEKLNSLFLENPNSSFYFNKGTYLVSGTLHLQNNIEICGDGVNTIIKCKTGSLNYGVEVIRGDNVKNVSIHDITIENTGYGLQNQNEGTLTNTGACILLTNSSFINIYNTTTKKGGGVFNEINQGIGNIYLSRCRYAKIFSNNILECQNGICLDDWVTGDNNTFNIIIDNNIVDNGNGRGIVLDLNANFYFNSCVVSNNNISNMGYSGIDVKGTTSSLIVGNKINGKATNKYYPNISLLDTQYGIQIDYDDNNSLIVGNHIQWTQCGILLSTFQNAFIKNNYIEISNNSTKKEVITIQNTKECRLDVTGNTLIDQSTGNNISIHNSNFKVELFLANNTLQGNLLVLSAKTTNIDIMKLIGNTLIGDLGVSLSAFKLLNCISNNVNCNQFVNLSGDVCVLKSNFMNGCNTGYRFYENLSFVKISDMFVGDIATVLFSTANATISHGDISGMEILLYNDESYSKIKDGGGLLNGQYYTNNESALINDNDKIFLQNNSSQYAKVKTSGGIKTINFD